MAAGRREAMRRQALAIVGCAFAENPKKADWDAFIKTGHLAQRKRYPIPMTPLIAREMERIKQHGGRFVLEEN